MNNLKCTGPPPSLWENCPPEILFIIFEMLDVQGLLNCMIVSTKWWSVSCNIIKRIGWDNVAEIALPDGGATIKKKSKLNIYDTVLNLGLWQEIYFAKAQNSYAYHEQEVQNLNVYGDYIIVVTHWEVKYFDFRNYELSKTLPISCVDFDENDHVFLKVELTLTNESKIGKFKTLTLYGKENKNSPMDPDKVFVHKNILYHRLHENCCYFTISEYCIFVATWNKEKWMTHLVARYFGFGTIIDVIVFKTDILALLNWGGMLQVDHDTLKCRMNNRKRSSVLLELPKYSFGITLYEKHGAIAAVPCDKTFCLRFNEPDYWVLECPGLSSVLKHANMILLGYSNGKIDIVNPSKFRPDDTCRLETQFSLSVQKLAGEDILDPAVRRLEVSEVKGCHFLFIVTARYIFQTTLGYDLVELT